MQITRNRIYFAVALAVLCALPFAGGCSKTDDTPTDAASPAAGTTAPGAAASPTAVENQGGTEKSAMPGGGPGK